MTIIGIRLKQARKTAGLSLQAVASITDMSDAAIKKYEEEDVYPSSDILIKLARALKIRVDFFFRPIKISRESVKFRKCKRIKGK
jgi:transcriptional regulator with XRE-family HTH domain